MSFIVPTRKRRNRAALGSALAVLALTLPALAGCGALEELDAAAAMMDPQKAEQAKAAERKQAPEEAEPKGLQWTDVKTLHAGELDQSFVRCKLGGSTQFMKSSDCRARGGRPDKV